MKVTGPDTRMIKIGPDEWAHVRGDGVSVLAQGSEIIAALKKLDRITSNSRVLILELAE